MGPKSKRLVVWGAGIQALVVWGAIRRIDSSLGGFFVFFPIYFKRFKYIYLSFKKKKKYPIPYTWIHQYYQVRLIKKKKINICNISDKYLINWIQ
jgi:hypothetical protein